MSYPGDPAGGQQQPSYQYPDGSGYPQQNPAWQGQPAHQPSWEAPDSGPPASAPFAPPGQAPAYGQSPGQAPGQSPAYGQDPGQYGGGYYDPNTPPASNPPTSGSPMYGGHMPGQMSGPPMAGPQMSAPPMSGPQMSGPPMSGPGGPPMSGAPVGGFGAAPAARRSPTTAILASVAVLFLLATAVLTVLYITRNGDYNEQKRTVAQRDQNIQDLNRDVERLKNDLKRVEGERDVAKRDLGGSEAQAAELKRQRSVISRCLTLLGQSGEAARKGDAATADAKSKEAKPVCDEAFTYLD